MVALERDKTVFQAQLQQQLQFQHEDAERAAEERHAARVIQQELISTSKALGEVCDGCKRPCLNPRLLTSRQ